MFYKKIAIQNVGHIGRGIFAHERICKNEKVVTFEGQILTDTEAHALGHENYVVPVGVDSYIDVAEPESLINHSCDPSTGFSDDKTLIALRDLEVGDQITFDYSTVTVDDWSMKCQCGSKNCRKRISNFQDLPKDLQISYQTITPKWVLKFKKH